MNTSASRPHARIVLDVPPLPEHVSAAGATLSRILAESSAPPDRGGMAELAAVELLSNIVRHGAPRTPIRLSLRCMRRAISIIIADDGPPFDMSAASCGLPRDPLAKNGRGLWIVKQAADLFRYRCRRGKNIHALIFFLSTPTTAGRNRW